MVALQIATSTRGSASAAAYERLHFVIYGLLAILFYRAFSSKLPRAWSALSTAAAVLGVGVGDEGLQWLVPLRTGEFFDLGLNLYGGVAGLLIAQAMPADLAVGSVAARRSSSVLVGLVLTSVALFIDRAHLGYEIEVPGVGNFRSFFTEQQLPEINADRADRWKREMPVLPLRKALDIEDYFLTEAGWHVGLRNQARKEGDTDLVWRETEILSRFYPATLEIPDGDWFRYRLPEAEQLRLDAYTPADRTYSSRADNGRIWVIPRFVVVIALCCSALVAGVLWRLAG